MAEKKEVKNIGEGLGISGFTLGILSILFAGYAGIIIAVIGGVFCFIQQKKNKTRIGKAGLILNIIGIVLSLIYIFYIAPLMSNLIQSAI
jgi:hypothetical protein